MALPARYEGAFAKHQRAQTHILALNDCLKTYHDGETWRPEQPEDKPSSFVRIRLLKLPPAELSLILGDIIHNLRASLDYATCSLVEFGNEGLDLRNVQFPFGRLGETLNSKERRPLDGIAQHALEMIEEARRIGGPWLDLLRAISNQDKHRLLITTTLRQYPMKVQIDSENNTADFVPAFDDEPDMWFKPIEDGDIIPMPNILHLKIGLVVDGRPAPYAIDVITRINEAVRAALVIMATAVDLEAMAKAGAGGK